MTAILWQSNVNLLRYSSMSVLSTEKIMIRVIEKSSVDSALKRYQVEVTFIEQPSVVL